MQEVLWEMQWRILTGKVYEEERVKNDKEGMLTIEIRVRFVRLVSAGTKVIVQAVGENEP